MRLVLFIFLSMFAVQANASHGLKNSFFDGFERDNRRMNTLSENINDDDLDYLIQGVSSVYVMKLLQCEGLNKNHKKCAREFGKALNRFIEKDHENSDVQYRIYEAAILALENYTIER